MSNNLTEKLSKDIMEEVLKLLGRGKQVLTCPLTREEIEEAWNATFDTRLLDAFKTLKEARYKIGYHTLQEMDVKMLVGNGLTRDVYRVTFRQTLLGRYNHENDNLDYFQQCWPLGEARWQEFVEWVVHAGIMNAEFTGAIWTTEKILKMCKTVGQVTRAMPELASLMPDRIQKQLKEQRRASGMPYDWASFPRNKVQAAQEALSKAYLLRVPEVPRQWYEVFVTWASKET